MTLVRVVYSISGNEYKYDKIYRILIENCKLMEPIFI
jgi:hypothetical protein